MCIRDRPAFVQWLHKIDPMAYSVDLVRYGLFGTTAEDPRMTHAFIVLTLLAVGSWIVSCVFLMLRRNIRTKDLHPELSV